MTRVSLDVTVHVDDSTGLSVNLDGAELETHRLCTGFMLKTTKVIKGYLCLQNA